jgi:hypothetical protein
MIEDQDGGLWRVWEARLANKAEPAALELARIPAHMAFWFGWFQFHRDTELYAGEE